MTTRVAIVGAGKIGTKHARVLHALPSVEVSHVVDTRSDAADAVAEQVDATAAPFEDALDDADAVYVCTPDDEHVEVAHTAIDRGAHTFVEKPLATNSDATADLARMAAESDGVHMVGHVLRFDPRYRQLRSAISNGSIGAVCSISATRLVARGRARRTGAQSSPAMRLGVHDFDVLQWLADEPLARLSAYEADGALRAEGYNIADTVTVSGEFDSGATVDLTLGFCLPESHPGSVVNATVVGTDGTATLDASGAETQVWTDDSGTYPDAHLWPEIAGQPDGALERESREYLDAIENDGASPVPFEAGRSAVAAAAAVERSIETGEQVTISQ